MNLAIDVRRVSSKVHREKAFSIRRRVFVIEQGIPEQIELDRNDARAIHFLAFVKGIAVGTARIVMFRGGAKIGRMAVFKSHRGNGIGKALLKRSVTTARKMGAQKIYLHAQVPVIGFYQAMGFKCVGRVFKEAGIPHRKMILASPGP